MSRTRNRVEPVLLCRLLASISRRKIAVKSLQAAWSRNRKAKNFYYKDIQKSLRSIKIAQAFLC
jgi:prephenate dehydratase